MITYSPIPGRIIDLIYAQMIRYDYSGCLRAANEQKLFVEDCHSMVPVSYTHLDVYKRQE